MQHHYPTRYRLTFSSPFCCRWTKTSTIAGITIPHPKEAWGSEEWIMSMKVSCSAALCVFIPQDADITKYILKPEGKHGVCNQITYWDWLHFTQVSSQCRAYHSSSHHSSSYLQSLPACSVFFYPVCSRVHMDVLNLEKVFIYPICSFLTLKLKCLGVVEE